MTRLRLFETVGMAGQRDAATSSVRGGSTRGGTDVQLKERTKTKLEQPPMYQVVLLNDDYTPMDFVVEVIQRFFHASVQEAVSIMLQVHNQGAGVCGVFTRDVAETKAEQVVHYARSHAHPLQCIVRKS